MKKLFTAKPQVMKLAACTLFLSMSATAQINIDTATRIVTPAPVPYKKPENKKPADLVKGFEKKEAEKKQQKDDAVSKAETAKNSSANDGIKEPDALPGLVTDDRLDSNHLASWKEYYSYMTFGYKHRKNVFAWQMFSSKIIFCIVIVLVLIGIYFAWLQFNLAMRNSKKPGDAAADLQTEITASGKEIKISSPVLGVIILLISLMFFYLYLRYVYPINEVF